LKGPRILTHRIRKTLDSVNTRILSDSSFSQQSVNLKYLIQILESSKQLSIIFQDNLLNVVVGRFKD